MKLFGVTPISGDSTLQPIYWPYVHDLDPDWPWPWARVHEDALPHTPTPFLSAEGFPCESQSSLILLDYPSPVCHLPVWFPPLWKLGTVHYSACCSMVVLPDQMTKQRSILSQSSPCFVLPFSPWLPRLLPCQMTKPACVISFVCQLHNKEYTMAMSFSLLYTCILHGNCQNAHIPALTFKYFPAAIPVFFGRPYCGQVPSEPIPPQLPLALKSMALLLRVAWRSTRFFFSVSTGSGQLPRNAPFRIFPLATTIST